MQNGRFVSQITSVLFRALEARSTRRYDRKAHSIADARAIYFFKFDIFRVEIRVILVLTICLFECN